MSVRIINQNRADFVQSIVNEFDRIHFPETNILDVVEPSPRQLALIDKRNGIDRSRSELPPELMGEIALQAVNFSHWSVIIGITDPVLEPGYRNEMLNYGAAKLVDRLQISSRLQSPRVQLLTYVFQEAFTTMPAEQQLALIERMKDEKKIVESLSFKVQLVFLRVQVAIADFFSHRYTLVAVGVFFTFSVFIFLAFITTKLEAWGIEYDFKIRRSAKHAGGSWTAAIGGVALLGIPRLLEKIVQNTTVQNRLFSQIENITNHSLTTLSTLAREQSNGTKKELILKAYQLWMHLMQNPESFYDKKALEGCHLIRG